jgi:hypothetical protein
MDEGCSIGKSNAEAQLLSIQCVLRGGPIDRRRVRRRRAWVLTMAAMTIVAHEVWDAGDRGCGELVLELRMRLA